MSATATQADARLIAAAIQRAGQIGKRQRVFIYGDADTVSAQSPTTDTVNYSTSYAFTWDQPPDGIYVVLVTGSAVFQHSASGLVNYRVKCQGVAGAKTGNTSVQAGTPGSRLEMTGLFFDVEVIAGVGMALAFEYKPNAAGTVNAWNPSLKVWAMLVS